MVVFLLLGSNCKRSPLKLKVILQSTLLIKNTFKSVCKFSALHVSPAVFPYSNNIDIHLCHCDHNDKVVCHRGMFLQTVIFFSKATAIMLYQITKYPA